MICTHKKSYFASHDERLIPFTIFRTNNILLIYLLVLAQENHNLNKPNSLKTALFYLA